PLNFVMGHFFVGFNWVFDRLSNAYGSLVRLILQLSSVMLLVYGGLIALTVFGFSRVPVGLLPPQGQGYLVIDAQLPDGARLDRTDAVVRKITEIAQADDAVGHVIGLPGYSVLTSNNISNSGGLFIILKPFEERAGKRHLSADALAARLRT